VQGEGKREDRILDLWLPPLKAPARDSGDWELAPAPGPRSLTEKASVACSRPLNRGRGVLLGYFVLVIVPSSGSLGRPNLDYLIGALTGLLGGTHRCHWASPAQSNPGGGPAIPLEAHRRWDSLLRPSTGRPQVPAVAASACLLEPCRVSLHSYGLHPSCFRRRSSFFRLPSLSLLHIQTSLFGKLSPSPEYSQRLVSPGAKAGWLPL
jgi:hypothetical protein